MTHLLLRIASCELMPRRIREDAMLVLSVIAWWSP